MKYLLLILLLLGGCVGMEYRWSLGCHPVRPVQVKWWLTSKEYAMDVCDAVFLNAAYVACARLNCQAGICDIFSSITEEEAAKQPAWDRRESVKSHELAHCDGEVH